MKDDVTLLHRIAIPLLALAVSISPAGATVVQVLGSGSALSRIDASADFELPADPTPEEILTFGNAPDYVEDGMVFRRIGADEDNNDGCGFGAVFATRCGPFAYPYGFDGNAFVNVAGAGTGIEIRAASGRLFSALEVRTGFGPSMEDPDFFLGTYWRAFNSVLGIVVGEGSLTLAPGAVLGFRDMSGQGFDALFLTQRQNVVVLEREAGFGAQIDQVRAEYVATPIPLPLSALSLLGGLLGLGALSWRGRRTGISGAA
jgi:hypothetical protein